MDSRLRIVVTGLIAQHPLGGVAWDYLQYPLGLARMGHEVWYLEDSGEWPYNLDGGDSGEDFRAVSCAPNVDYLAGVMREWGLADRWAYRCPMNDEWSGLAASKVEAIVEHADLVLNVSGSLAHPERYRGRGRLAYIDSDPVFTQIELIDGDQRAVQAADAHDVHFSFGELVSSAFPSSGYSWRPTRQPIVIDEWRAVAPQMGPYTTVMNWSSYRPALYGGRRFGMKDVEFARFLELPKLVDVEFEVATKGTAKGIFPTTDRDDDEAAALTPDAALRGSGWRVVDATTACAGMHGYRSYIQRSRAEWSVGKQAYVAGRSGWFSGRSACYLAAGRPVILQDTGFSEILPVGEGLLAFDTLEEAADAIRRVEEDYDRHASAALAIASEYFDSARVLPRLLDEAMSVSTR